MQIARTVEQMVVKEISALVPKSLDDIVHCPDENAGTGVCSVIYNAVEQVVLDVQHRDFIGDTLFRHISTYLYTGDAADKVCRKLLSTNFVMPSISAFILRRTSKAFAAELYSTKEEEQLNALIPDPAAKHVKVGITA